MSSSLLRHEQESKELAEKLTIMKNQIMETQVGKAIKKKFPAIKIGSLKSEPAFVLFKNQSNIPSLDNVCLRGEEQFLHGH